MSGECDEYLINVLKKISNLLDNIQYERSGRICTLEEDEMSWIFYCRDLADEAIRLHGEKDVG